MNPLTPALRLSEDPATRRAMVIELANGGMLWANGDSIETLSELDNLTSFANTAWGIQRAGSRAYWFSIAEPTGYTTCNSVRHFLAYCRAHP